MNFLLYCSEIIMPLTIAYIIAHGLAARRNIFEDFTTGAMSGIQTTVELLPTLIGLLMGTHVLRTSGLLEFLCNQFALILDTIGIDFIPEELLPLATLKLFSASAANGLLFDLFKEFGTDSYIGLAASIMMSCSETMLYCISIYFGSVNISKTRWTIPGALASILAGFFASLALASFLCQP